ncbi:endonuclease-reverse transcriptase [Plakobranchus ocellatus]|uniref:Endonuclease-reverse transcriptase n=1 Tax=Plakobranchus ocellatus TaxID=259542 RepID=A0AAV3Z3U0_9GAST|nr:endonuclease-reverse transcriptase [Plakobranchus ocellatus]
MRSKSISKHYCSKDREERLEAVEMWFIRRIMKISWTKRETNAEVKDMAGCKRSLLNTIRERQLKIFGLIFRAGGVEKLLWSAKIYGKICAQNSQTGLTNLRLIKRAPTMSS